MTSSADAILQALQSSVEAAQSGLDLGCLGRTGLLRFVRDFETLRNQLTAVDHQIMTAVDTAGLASELVARDSAGVLVHVLGISRAEARRRMSASATLAPRQSVVGDLLPPTYPQLAALEASGRLSAEHRTIAVGCLQRMKQAFLATPDALTRAETTLVQNAPNLDVDSYRKVGDLIINCEYPDGLLPDEDTIQAARDLRIRARRDGTYQISGRLTGECGALINAALGPLSAPVPETEKQKDPRSVAQRLHDGLLTLAQLVLRSGGLPRQGGVPTSLIVHIPLSDLVAGGGSGVTADGQCLTPAAMQRLLHEAEILPTVINRTGRVLWQQTDSRIATPGQTKYLIARDHGCSFPGCDRPPAHCERHHIIPWADGGLTHVDNLTLLCGYHHRNFESRGWTCSMIDGLPHWTAPPRYDPWQKPRLSPTIVINTARVHRTSRLRT